jgi:RNA:NAD 2'-phosphotransferase (TPT1/KptA family)
MNMEALKRLSKHLSYILRHNPKGLRLDKEGFANVEDILQILKVSEKELEELIASSEKERFEIKNGKIRARYGHSKVKVKYRPAEYREPPEVLYHGTSEEVVNSILKEGIEPRGRRFVHLSEDIDEAYKTGRRHTDCPKVLVIKAKEAYDAGIRFISQKGIWLTEYIPQRFVEPLCDKKAEIRERIWQTLEKERIAPFCFGRIPNFKGKEEAAKILARQDFFKSANCIFSAPDGSLLPVREMVLKEGKILVVALPRMKGFVEIENPENIKEAATIKGFLKYGKLLSGKKIDLFIQGAVAVDRAGNRLGKGSGFGDREWDHFEKSALLQKGCKMVCIVHSSQIVENMSNIMHSYDKEHRLYSDRKGHNLCKSLWQVIHPSHQSQS